jgi:hypothetical protein
MPAFVVAQNRAITTKGTKVPEVKAGIAGWNFALRDEGRCFDLF